MMHAFQKTIGTEDSVFNTFLKSILKEQSKFYIMKEQKKKRIVCEDQPQRRLTDTSYIKTQVFRLLRYYSPAPRNIARSDWATQNITHNMTSPIT